MAEHCLLPFVAKGATQGALWAATGHWGAGTQHPIGWRSLSRHHRQNGCTHHCQVPAEGLLVLSHFCFLFSLPILISVTISQIYNQVRDGCFERGSALCKERLCLHTVTLLDVWKQEICCATSPCPSHTSHTDTHTTNVIYTLYIIHSLLLVEAPLFSPQAGRCQFELWFSFLLFI